MSTAQENTRQIMRGMSIFLEFNELEGTKQKFPETEWKVIARRFIQYVHLAERALDLSSADLQVIHEVNEFFAKAKAKNDGKTYDPSKQTGAAKFLEAIGPEEKEKLNN